MYEKVHHYLIYGIVNFFMGLIFHESHLVKKKMVPSVLCSCEGKMLYVLQGNACDWKIMFYCREC